MSCGLDDAVVREPFHRGFGWMVVVVLFYQLPEVGDLLRRFGEVVVRQLDHSFSDGGDVGPCPKLEVGSAAVCIEDLPQGSHLKRFQEVQPVV